MPLEPDELRREVATALRRVRERHEGKAPEPAREAPKRAVVEASSGPRARSHPERFGVLQALLAYLLAACGEDKEAQIPAAELVERFRDPGARSSRSTSRC